MYKEVWIANYKFKEKKIINYNKKTLINNKIKTSYN